jgi:HEAT repeat protein
MHILDNHNAETPKQIIQRLYATPYSRTWWHAIDHLSWFGTTAVPALIEALTADSVPVRRAAAQALGRIGPRARQATRPLLDSLFDGTSDVRFDAAWALTRIAPPLKAALPLLLGRLAAEENRAVQRLLIRILGNIGPAAQSSLPLIYPKLDDSYLFPDALYALQSIAPKDPRLLRVLYDQVSTAQAPFRALAAETAGKLRLRTPEWITALTIATGCSDAQTRHAARNALNKIQSAGQRSARR